MRFLVLPLLLLISNKALACSGKIDNSKVMLFIDTNFSDLEIETAQRAACKRGEKLVVIPKNYKEYTSQIRVVEEKLKRLNRCKSNCEPLAQDYAAAEIALQTKRDSEGLLKDLIAKELNEMKQKNVKLTNMLLSGHDGGGHFGGYKGSISRSDMANIMEDFQDINEVSTLMLLGCYTGVQKEIAHWKGIFPKVRMIGGYDGSAPLSDKPMGHHYLEDLLTKEKALLQQADEKQLNQFVRANIRGLHSMHSAVYLEPVCSEEEDSSLNAMYYGSLTNRRFSTFDLNQCIGKVSKIKEIETRFKKFDSGEVEPPKNPSDPAIKTLYDQARSLEHCIEQLESPVDVNAIFNLRFYEAVKENFATFYKDELQTAQEALDSFDVTSAIEGIDREIANIAEFERKIEEENEKIKNDPEGYFFNLETLARAREHELQQMLNDPEKLAILNKMQNPNYKSSPEDEFLYDRYTALKEEINTIQSKQMYKESPSFLISHNNMSASMRLYELENSKRTLQTIKDNAVWLPTHENLKKYSRKEMRENIHKISDLLTLKVLPRKVRLSLDWTVRAKHEHLTYFQNPFEWHEVTSRVTPPENKISMGQTIYAPSSNPGYQFGFGMGTFGSGSESGLFSIPGL
ncbi:MAG TPA: hypothetical protein VKY27_02710 [Bacteriovoracaceae bacterium]|nr:hypothetical protein [Bacteriovoracaceae bacterium]